MKGAEEVEKFVAIEQNIEMRLSCCYFWSVMTFANESNGVFVFYCYGNSIT